MPDTPRGPLPKWKVFVVTLLGVHPTSLLLTITVGVWTRAWPLLLSSIVFNVAMVAFLTWLVIPSLTRVLRPWLKAEEPENAL